MTRTLPAGPRDRGDIVLGWLTRVTLVLGVLGLLGFDAIALGVGRLTAEDHAQQASGAAVRALRDGADLQAAYEAALEEVDAVTETIAPADFVPAPDGSVTLTVRRTSPTLVVSRVGPIEDWATSEVTVTGRPAL